MKGSCICLHGNIHLYMLVTAYLLTTGTRQNSQAPHSRIPRMRQGRVYRKFILMFARGLFGEIRDNLKSQI